MVRVLTALVVMMAAGSTALSQAPVDARETQAPSASSIQKALSSVAIPGSLGATVSVSNVTVTGTAGGGVSATATMTAGADPTQMSVSLQYTDANDWTVTVAKGSAGGAYAPLSPISLNINNVSGTVSMSGGSLSIALALSGYTVGDSTVDLTVSISASGLVGYAQVSDLNIGGTTVDPANVTVTSADHTISVVGDIATPGGTFDASMTLTSATPLLCIWGTCEDLPAGIDPSLVTSRSDLSPNGLRYSAQVTLTGADLAGTSDGFGLTSFATTVTVDAPNSGCLTVNTTASGSMKIGGNVLTLDDVTLGFSCNTLTAFELAVTYTHYSTQALSKSATLAIAWADCASGASCTYKLPTGTVVAYDNGYFGFADFAVTLGFSKKYDDRTFSRDITFGVGLGVAVYTPAPSGTQTTAIVAGGGVTADRVGGDLGCSVITSTSTDFSCTASFHVNPEWAGKYGETWTGF